MSKTLLGAVVLALVAFLFSSLTLITTTQDYCMHLSTLKKVETGVGIINVDDLVKCRKFLGDEDFQRLTLNTAQRGTANVVYGSEHFAVLLNGRFESATPEISETVPFNYAKFEYRSDWNNPFLYARDIIVVNGCVPQKYQPGVMYIFADCALK